MASSKEMCETCLFDTKNNEATLFCVDCNEPLCDGCGAVHRKQRLSRHHKLFDIGNAPPTEVLATLRALTACPNHLAEEVEYVCREHDQLCCSKCANTVHRKCDQLETIADLMDKPNANDTKPIVELGKFKDFAKEMKDHESKHKAAIEESVTETDTTLQQTQAKLKEALEGLNVRINHEKEIQKDKLKKHSEKQDFAIQIFERKVEEERKKMESVSKHGQPVHCFLLGWEMKKSTLAALKKGASEIKKSASQHVLVCKHSKSYDGLEREIGVCLEIDANALPVCQVSIPYVPNTLSQDPIQIGTIELRVAEKHDFQNDMSRRGRANRQWKRMTPQADTIPGQCSLVWMDGLLIILDERLSEIRVVNWPEKRIYCNQIGNIIPEFYTYNAAEECCISDLNGADFAYCNSRFKKVFVMNATETNVVVRKQIQMQDTVNLLCKDKDSGCIVALSKRRSTLMLLSTDGKLVGELPAGHSLSKYINNAGSMAYANGMVYLTCTTQNQVVGFSIDGSLRFTYTHQNLHRPGAAVVGPNNTLFVASRGGNAIHVVDADGKQVKKLLHGKIEAPCALAFDNCMEHMAVLQENDVIKMFKFK
ncbi:uncharacterized protein LOC128216662 [Mya arenaria]|uniref:uncharacterized protein LOC128216662 n=1 Tax=Mya arenaria TaxID=6604 RepID=UPI0022E77D18|nr:uncharacterized protein LOC128216662 [Mya arenaria]